VCSSDLCGLNKKFKLGLNNPTLEMVKTWVANAGELS
jgi:hypothetical protein